MVHLNAQNRVDGVVGLLTYSRLSKSILNLTITLLDPGILFEVSNTVIFKSVSKISFAIWNSWPVESAG